ncbi:MAG: ABC transporter substrate-binding protein [Ostreibacterium sp.]
MKKYLEIICKITIIVASVTTMFGGIVQAQAKSLQVILCGTTITDTEKQAKVAFEKAHPDVTVNFEGVPWGQCQHKVITLAASGSAPALAYIGSRTLKQLYKNELIIPVTLNAEEQAAYWPIVLKTVKYQGKVLGFPRAFSTKAMVYNKDLFADVGYTTFPKTWKEFLDATTKIKAKGVAGYGLIAKDFDQTEHHFLNWLYTNGGAVLDNDGKVVFDSKNSLQTLELYKQLVSVAESGPTAYEREGLRNLFNDGKLASFIFPPMFLNKMNKEINWGVANIPHGPMGSSGTMLITDSLAVFKGTGVEKEATSFARFLTNPKYQPMYEDEYSFTPLRPGERANNLVKKDPKWKPFLDGISRGGPEPLFTDYIAGQQAFIKNIQSLVLGDITPKEAMANITKTLIKLEQ